MHRNRIIDEVKLRLAAKFPGAVFLEEQSYDPARMPSYSIWEDTENSDKYKNMTKKGYRIYTRRLPIEMEFCFLEEETEKQKEEGRIRIQEIREAIEPEGDFWLVENATGEKLVTEYFEESADVALIYTPITIAVVRYVFEYADTI